MDFAEIQQLMHEFSNSSISRLNLEMDSIKITLEKQISDMQPVHQPSMYQPVTAVAAQPIADAVAVNEDEMQAKEDETAVCSPVVGVFYATPSPDAAPFVSVGQTVEKGQTLCIVEAMKMMNEIPAPVSGRIARIVAKPEEAVEYNQPLMFIQPA